MLCVSNSHHQQHLLHKQTCLRFTRLTGLPSRCALAKLTEKTMSRQVQLMTCKASIRSSAASARVGLS